MQTENTTQDKSKYNLAPLDNSVVFKKLFRDAEVLNAFIKDLLGLDIDIQPEQIETEKKFTPPIGNVDIAYDIFVDDPRNRIIIEIQRVHYPEHYERFRYYFMAAILEMVKSHREYRGHRAVYTIVWLTRKVKETANKRSIITEYIGRETNRNEVTKPDPHRLIFLNPNYIDDQTPPGVVDWMQLVMESMENPKAPSLNFERPIIEKAIQLIDDDGLTPQEVAKLMNEREYERHLVSRHEAGKATGIEEGKVVGREEGIKIGELQTLRNMLTTMLPQKFPNLQENGLPDWISNQIETCTEPKQLQAWTAGILTENSLDEIFKMA